MLRRSFRYAFVALGLALAGAVQAQSWPVKTVRIIVPFAPGGRHRHPGRLLSKEIL